MDDENILSQQEIDNLIYQRDMYEQALIELFNGGKLLRVPRDWDYFGMGRSPDVEEMEDVTSIVEDALQFKGDF